jgi:uncharacterized membrane protein
MDLPEILVNAIFILLLASITLWILVYRRLDRRQPGKDRYYRYHQVLIGLIALLAILLGVIIVLSSDPGGPDLYLRGY